MVAAVDAGLLFGIVAVVAALTFLVSRYLRLVRRQTLAKVAAEHGLRFSPEDPFGLLDLSVRAPAEGDGRGERHPGGGVLLPFRTLSSPGLWRTMRAEPLRRSV